MASNPQTDSGPESPPRRRLWAEWLRARFTDTQRYLILWALVGVTCGLAAVLFHKSIDSVFALWQSFASPSKDDPSLALPLAILVGGPTFGGLCAGLIVRFACPSSAGSGIPQTKARYYNKFGIFRLTEAFWRFIGGTLCVGFGMSLGREGPTVHICATIASKLGQLFGIAKKRVQAMVPVGMGAGIAAAFNAPVSAMFFVFEELLGDFSTKSLFGILVAVVIAATVERLILGEHPAFTVLEVHYTTDLWMLLAIPLGLLAAFLGHLFTRMLLASRQRAKEATFLPSWVKPALGGLGVGILGGSVLLLTQGHFGVFGIGYQDLSDALNGQMLAWSTLAALLLGKFLACILSYATGGSGGLFAPVLFIGGMLGALLAVTASGILGLFGFSGLDPTVVGALALIGMGAFFAAVIRCPFTSIMIVFEMTQNYSLVLPLMTANALSYLVASRLRPVGLYDSLLAQDKVSLKKALAYQGQQDWRNLPVSSIMSFDPTTLLADDTPAQALAKLDGTHLYNAYPVLDAHGHLRGILQLRDLQNAAKAGPDQPVHKLLGQHKLLTLTPDTSIRDAAHALVIGDVLQAPVVQKLHPERLVGLITLHDIARQQNAITDTLER